MSTLDHKDLFVLIVLTGVAAAVLISLTRTVNRTTVNFTCYGDFDSATVYPETAPMPKKGDTLQLTGICWKGDKIRDCSGACDTIPPWMFYSDGAVEM